MDCFVKSDGGIWKIVFGAVADASTGGVTLPIIPSLHLKLILSKTSHSWYQTFFFYLYLDDNINL